MAPWQRKLNADPLPWLLDPADPAPRHLALRYLLDLPVDAPEVMAARTVAMQADPIASILAAQHSEGYWDRPGPGYAPKYRGTVWQLMFLDQLGADGADGQDDRIQAACEYVLQHAQAQSGGFAYWQGGRREVAPPPSLVIHCLNGNLLRALIGFGWLNDPRVQRAIEWQAGAITGADFNAYYRSGTTGPNFQCSSNAGAPCAWGAIKALLGLARIPADQRSSLVERAITQGVEFLLSHDPAIANYPTGQSDDTPSPLWFKLGFPLGYTADLLQNLSVFGELGYASDPRLANAVAWLLSQQDAAGRWRNDAPLSGKMWVDIDRSGQPSKWVTLRACVALKAMYG